MAYTIRIELESDDAENAACFTCRGFDFTSAIRAVFDPRRIVVQDRRWDYGEDHNRAIGIDERAKVVISQFEFRSSALFLPARPTRGSEL